MSKKNSIVAMVLGIVAAVAGINGLESWGILAVVGLVCAIISFNFQKKANEAGEMNGFLKAAKITSIIGLIFSIIGLVGGIICGICICTGAAVLGGLEAAAAQAGSLL